MWSTRGDAQPIASIYAQNGVHLTEAGKGKGSRVAGWQRLRTYLAEAPACPHHRAMNWETCPKIHIFHNCENLIRTLPAVPHATTGDPEDIDTTSEDHACDALRYLLINLGGGPHFPLIGEPEQPQQPDPDQPGPLWVPTATAQQLLVPGRPGAWWDPTEKDPAATGRPPAWF
jgi:hypothetical protein